MKKLAVLCLVLGLAACTKDSPLGPDPVPSPEPSASPAPQREVYVRAEVRQGGVITTGVEANTDFKVSGTATACYLDGQKVDCGLIPYWDQFVVGGQDSNCSQFGSLSSNTRTWFCREPGEVTIRVCALDRDKSQLGCDETVVFVG